MHSSRMRTGSTLTVCRSLLLGGVSSWGDTSFRGVSWAALGGVPTSSGVGGWGLLPGGLLGGGVFLLGGLLPREGLLMGVGWWVSLPGGLLLGGISLPGGLLLGRPPPVNRITHSCKKHYLGHNFVAAGNNEP